MTHTRRYAGMKIGPALLAWGALAVNPVYSSAPATAPGALKTSARRVGQSHQPRSAFLSSTAKRSSPTHRAVVFNPGGSATDLAPGFADATSGALATLRDRYDILLVDNRGTGKSAPLHYNFAPAEAWPPTI